MGNLSRDAIIEQRSIEAQLELRAHLRLDARVARARRPDGRGPARPGNRPVDVLAGGGGRLATRLPPRSAYAERVEQVEVPEAFLGHDPRARDLRVLLRRSVNAERRVVVEAHRADHEDPTVPAHLFLDVEAQGPVLDERVAGGDRGGGQLVDRGRQRRSEAGSVAGEEVLFVRVVLGSERRLEPPRIAHVGVQRERVIEAEIRLHGSFVYHRPVHRLGVHRRPSVLEVGQVLRHGARFQREQVPVGVPALVDPDDEPLRERRRDTRETEVTGLEVQRSGPREARVVPRGFDVGHVRRQVLLEATETGVGARALGPVERIDAVQIKAVGPEQVLPESAVGDGRSREPRVSVHEPCGHVERELVREDYAHVAADPERLVLVVPDDALFLLVIGREEVTDRLRASAHVHVVALVETVLIEVFSRPGEVSLPDIPVRLVVHIVAREFRFG